MGLLKCKDCGTEHSDMDKTICPSCGRKYRSSGSQERGVETFFVFIVIGFVLYCSLYGCEMKVWPFNH
jgi:uncharacterized protein (DUF983 family)